MFSAVVVYILFKTVRWQSQDPTWSSFGRLRMRLHLRARVTGKCLQAVTHRNSECRTRIAIREARTRCPRERWAGGVDSCLSLVIRSVRTNENFGAGVLIHDMTIRFRKQVLIRLRSAGVLVRHSKNFRASISSFFSLLKRR